MEIRVLQSLIDRTSNDIQCLEVHKVMLKQRQRISEPYYKEEYEKYISNARKKIKKLVELQKSLKEEIKWEIGLMRFEKSVKEGFQRILVV